MRTIRWGVIGSGWVSRMFATSMKAVQGGVIYAVADAALEIAQGYQKQFGVEKVFASPEAMVQDEAVDAIYVGTPHSFHKRYMELAINHGKPVLCVKPITLHTADFEEVIKLAREKNVLVMEGMWSRFKPEFVNAKKSLLAGEIGELVRAEGRCNFQAAYDPQNRLYNLALGGGALLDVGVYMVSLMDFFMDCAPDRIQAMAHIGPSGVDHTTNMMFGYKNGVVASFTSSISSDVCQDMLLVGTEGTIHINDLWYSDSYTITPYGQEPQTRRFPLEASLQPEKFEYMIEAFNGYVREGKRDSDVISNDITLRVMRTMDEILAQIGVQYA